MSNTPIQKIISFSIIILLLLHPFSYVLAQETIKKPEVGLTQFYIEEVYIIPVQDRFSTTPSANLQDLNYIYDNVGNITQIIDAFTTDTKKIANYTYDDLNRLTSAVVTNTQTPYTENYTYDAIGNILTKNGQIYSYTGTDYANSHAVTSINGITNTYDQNGNLLSDGTLVNVWNYKNQLTQTTKGTTTSTYTYDHTGQRVKLTAGTLTTYYPSKYYNIDSNGKKDKGTATIKQMLTKPKSKFNISYGVYDKESHIKTNPKMPLTPKQKIISL